MADDFETAMNGWLNKVESQLSPSTAKRAEITGVGGAIFARELKSETPRSDVDYGETGKKAGHATIRKTKHLQDSITYMPGFIVGGLNTGDTDVGYEDHYFDFVARINNNERKTPMSPKQLKNLHFAQRAQAKAIPLIRAAMLAKVKELGK